MSYSLYKEQEAATEAAFVNWRKKHRVGTWAWYPSPADVVRLARTELAMRDDRADRRLS